MNKTKRIINWIKCKICVEDATQITEEDLSIINDIVLFLKTKAEESKKEWDEEHTKNKN